MREPARALQANATPNPIRAAQEAGRAGRDGLPATSIVYFSQRDRRRRQFLLGAEQRRRRRQGQASSDGRDQLQQFGQVRLPALR
jgi:superfamily II DNA helicase RecQ